MEREMMISCENEKQALEKACEKFQCERKDLQIEEIRPAKRSLFGKVKQLGEYKVLFVKEQGVDVAEQTESMGKKRQTSSDTTLDKKIHLAVEYLQSVCEAFDVGKIEIQAQPEQDYVSVNLLGENVGALIGHRGETLDAIQYLTCLVANQAKGNYTRFVLNSGDFRQKRRQTLEALGKRMAEKALRQNRKVVLDAMNPYERRIVHSAVSQMDGVYTKSVGREPDRKVIIFVEKERFYQTMHKEKASKQRDETFSSSQPSTYNFEKQFLKDENASYGKIEMDD